MTLVSGNIWYMQIFAWVPVGGDFKLLRTAIFGDLSGYFFGKFRYKASKII